MKSLSLVTIFCFAFLSNLQSSPNVEYSFPEELLQSLLIQQENNPSCELKSEWVNVLGIATDDGRLVVLACVPRAKGNKELSYGLSVYGKDLDGAALRNVEVVSFDVDNSALGKWINAWEINCTDAPKEGIAARLSVTLSTQKDRLIRDFLIKLYMLGDEQIVCIELLTPER